MKVTNIEWRMTLDNGKQYGESLNLTVYDDGDDDFVYRQIKALADQMKRTYDKLNEEQ